MTDWSQREIDDVRYGTKDSADELKKLNQKQDKALENDRAILEAFNRLTRQLEVLTDEVRGLREDLNPKLEKPGKLPSPGKS